MFYKKIIDKNNVFARFIFATLVFGTIFYIISLIYFLGSAINVEPQGKAESELKFEFKTKTKDIISELIDAQPTNLKPDGELADIFAFGSNYTDLQRELKLAKIVGQVVQWKLPVFEVKRDGNGYMIQTSSKSGFLNGSKLTGTFIHITPVDDDDRRLVEKLKTGETISFKGVVRGTTMRNIDIQPAILFNEPPKAISEEPFNKEILRDALEIASNYDKHCPDEGECNVNEFAFIPTDLNSDGTKELIVTNRGFCGSGGCTSLIISKNTSEEWSVLVSLFGFINVLSSKKNGFNDILYITKIYPSDEPWYLAGQKFSWSGHEYVPEGRRKRLP